MHKTNKITFYEKENTKDVLFFIENKIDIFDSIIKDTKLKLKILRKECKSEAYDKLTEKLKKKEKDPRHFAPANKEWNNSTYAYNKTYLLDLASKDKTASAYIKSYFDMVPIPSLITKSKRMRDLIRRSSTKQLFVSKPEVKQTNDNATITVYTFDREKRLWNRKLFFLRKWLNENLLGKRLRKKKSKLKLIYKLMRSKKIIKKNLMFKKHIIYKKRLRYRKKRNVLKKKISRYNAGNDLFIKTADMLLKKRKYLLNIFFYRYLKRILALFFDKKLFFLPEKTGNSGSFAIRKRKKYVIRTKEGRIRHLKPKDFRLFKVKKLNLKTLRSINILLFKFLIYKSKKDYLKNYILIFNKLKNKYEKALKQKYIKKEVLIVKYLSNLYINEFKYYSFLPGLKSILSKIYNKKVRFNLVKLRNLHLNSDIFSEAISIKLRKRTTSLLRILRRSFNFIKKIKPNEKYILIQKLKNFPAKEIKTYFGKYNVINGNIINKLMNHMNTNKRFTIIEGILQSVKYKWVSGARIEAKGRLTKRYAASRALFKYKYRGTLRNLENLKNMENYLQSPGVSMLRGDSRPNNQYSLIHSKRRIGAFGIKGWISNS